MLMFLYVVLSIVTFVYLILATKMDLKERQIYTMPCFFLTISWSLYLLDTEAFVWQELVLYWLLIHVLWRLFNRYKVWGEGDSDIFILLCNVILATLWSGSWVTILIADCVCLICALAVAILVAVFEYGDMNLRLEPDSKVAVVPGFSVVICCLLIFGFIGRVI